ncbi:hypothetical protein AVEN_70823-1 [Araneus ventricosus]|uniref:Helitron helicase-like domain-containing protein n=1 Tax=Araneus ventricosus TaxID=182803 RepID=A0A4Y2M3M3_ARAVE|nr:hypothetical protein AVEN_70823-1 [Araneus ventricosus]
MLREINPFAQSDLQMYRLVQEHPTTSVKMVFLEDKNLDMRRYNAPTLCTEVAAIFVDSESKIRTEDDIDKFVSAELTDPCTDLRLFQIVTKCMVHDPCGTININSPCMRDGQCCKSFPKQFMDDTEENVNGYPIYRRRATEPVQVGKYSIDNRWVVPYNPWLLKKFNAHINVEVCSSVKSVKYLYKYVYKGHDAASVKIQKEGALDHNEILSFVEGRYVSAPEAM